MRRAMLVATAMMAMAVPAAAMVPHNIQRRGELRQIFAMPDLVERLGEPIERIERIGEGLWRVSAGRCRIDIRFVRGRSVRGGLLPPRMMPQMVERICGR